MSTAGSKAKKPPAFLVLIPVYIALALFFALLIRRGNVQLLEPAGYVARLQSYILWGAIIFAGVVGSSIVALFFFVVFRYREGKRATYMPDWVPGKMFVALAWLVPFLAIVAISFMVWQTAHLADPFRPISSAKAPMTIQVVALRWKWLFLYPGEHIATINMLEIPVDTPVKLELTADGPMNSFWVPRLSGQVYAMTGMATQLHLMVDKAGSYAGSSAEISGDGFADMGFTVKAVSDTEYAAWKTSASRAAILDYTSYAELAKPSSYSSPATYRAPDPHLFDEIIMQFMVPSTSNEGAHV